MPATRLTPDPFHAVSRKRTSLPPDFFFPADAMEQGCCSPPFHELVSLRTAAQRFGFPAVFIAGSRRGQAVLKTNTQNGCQVPTIALWEICLQGGLRPTAYRARITFVILCHNACL